MTLKKTPLEIVSDLKKEIAFLSEQIKSKQLLSGAETIRFSCEKFFCECGMKLKVLKTRKKKAVTLAIGEFIAHETILNCKKCENIYYPESLRGLIPFQGNFGFDVIVYIGESLFLQHLSDSEVQKKLKERNIPISLREIAFLGKKFITYLAIVHYESSEKIKDHINQQGGYILHLDGTCEGGSPHLFSSLDSTSGIILHNIKVPSENSKYIIPFLKDIESRYGAPIAVVSDMSSAIIKAVETTYLSTKIYVCHFHFLRDVGKDLLNKDYQNVRRILSNHKIYAVLRKVVRELKCTIDRSEDFTNALEGALKVNQWKEVIGQLPAVVSVYILVSWALEAKQISHGYGFPFDQPHVVFYKRLMEVYPIIEKLREELEINRIKLPMTEILRVYRDIALKETVILADEKILLFNELRKAMRITLNTSKKGLNDEGHSDINSIEKNVKQFRSSKKLEKLSDMVARKKLEKQIDKYQEKLFADPISIESEGGKIKVTPQRTNNSMEQFFRSFKRGSRKKLGTSSLSKMMQSMSPNMALVPNLNKPEYLEQILNGRASLAERFSEIDHQLVLEEMRKENEIARKYHKGMAKLFKVEQLPQIMLHGIRKQAVGE